MLYWSCHRASYVAQTTSGLRALRRLGWTNSLSVPIASRARGRYKLRGRTGGGPGIGIERIECLLHVADPSSWLPICAGWQEVVQPSPWRITLVYAARR